MNSVLTLDTRLASIEAEQSVLAAVLLDNDVMLEIGEMLEARDFTQHAHMLIWRGMKYMWNQNRPIDIVTLTQELVKYKRLEEVGGMEYLTQLMDLVPTAQNAKYHAEIVRNLALRRRGVEIGEKIIRLSQEIADTERYFDEVENLAASLRPDESGKMVSLADAKKEYFEYLRSSENLVPTGFKKFDEWSGGIPRGSLYILAGRPSVGKTAKALQQAVNMAERNIGHVLIWSQEMTRNQLINRMISPISGVHATRIRKRTLEPFEWERIEQAYEKLEKLPIHVEDASGVSIEHVASVARQFKRRYGRIGALFVDYLTIMDIRQEKGQTRSQAVGEVTKRAKWLAVELDAPFIMLAQLSREGVDGEPQLHHLRDSGEIEQDADIVEFLWHNPDEDLPHAKIVQSFIAKGRDLGVNRFKYKFTGYLQKYEDHFE